MNKTTFESETKINNPATSTAVEIAIFRLNDLKNETDVPNATNSPIQFLFPNNNLGNLQKTKKSGYPKINAISLKNFFVLNINSKNTSKTKKIKNLYSSTQENFGR